METSNKISPSGLSVATRENEISGLNGTGPCGARGMPPHRQNPCSHLFIQPNFLFLI
tara:strand:- start:504 stop:674 length:171 start_codon:yes stop_codon:yes gene_type:complete